MGSTPNYSWPYPALGDAPDGASQIQALASAVDTTLAAQVASLQSQLDAIVVPITVYKTAALTRSSTTLTADPDLAVTVAASSAYEVRASFIYQSGTSGIGFKFSFTAPSGFGGAYSAGVQTACVGEVWSSTPVGSNADASVYAVQILGILTTSTTSGTFGLKWASNTSGQNQTLGAGSYLTVQQIG